MRARRFLAARGDRRSRVTEDVLDDDWVRPYRSERQTAPTWTTVGTIGSAREAIVDRRGLVTPEPGGWSLDWWIGADDRWHVPSREIAVRQRLLDDMPVVETSMRVPGGDAVQRVFGVRDGDRDLIVVEIENRSSLPFAVALAVRPWNPEGLATVERIGLQDDSAVTVDGRVAMLLPKKPSRVAGSTFAAGDVATAVMTGAAGESFPADLRDEAGVATAAFVFPLPHTATLRVGLPIEAVPRATRPMGALPSATQVASGWGVHTDRGMRIAVPDPKLTSCVAASRAQLLLGRRDDVHVLAALVRYGYRREVADVVDSEPDLVATIAHGAEVVARNRPVGARRALLDASEVLAAIGEARAAADASRLAASLAEDPARGIDWLQSTLAAASPTWTWSDAGTATEVLAFVRDLLVRETPERGLALCSLVPDDWLGQGIEVHDAPTPVGTISFAVRWHGDRPALLWELDRHADVDHEVRITVPGLDRSWSSTDAKGEALLGVVVPPGQISAVSLRRS